MSIAYKPDRLQIPRLISAVNTYAMKVSPTHDPNKISCQEMLKDLWDRARYSSGSSSNQRWYDNPSGGRYGRSCHRHLPTSNGFSQSIMIPLFAFLLTCPFTVVIAVPQLDDLVPDPTVFPACEYATVPCLILVTYHSPYMSIH